MVAFPDEETPLLYDGHHKTVDGCDRFSPTEKRRILALVSFLGLLPLFVGAAFIPLIPQISKDMNTTAAVISLTVSVSILATSIGSLIGAPYSTVYGRRPIYLIGIPVFVISSIGVGISQSTVQLLLWRFLQAMGSSPSLTIGTAVIGDIYTLEERGTATGIFFAAILMGQTLAPIFGGFAVYYSSWRVLQLAVGLVGLCGFILMYQFLPETHEGVNNNPDSKSQTTWINPIRPLALLRNLNLLLVSCAGFANILTYYVLLVPIAYTIGKQYGITNEATIGACILPCGLGNIVGAIMAGRLSDRVVVQWREKRGGKYYPEDRLRAAIPSSSLIIPLSILFSGLCVTYVPGKLGIALNLLCLFFNGAGQDGVLGPSATYVVDSMHDRSAEALAANSGFRQALTALAISGIIPAVEKHGVLIINTSAAMFAWLGCFLFWITIRYGDRLRAKN